MLLLFLPDSIASAEFLTEEERKVAEQRVQVAGTGKIKRSWKVDQIIECLLDPKTFFFFGISLLTQVLFILFLFFCSHYLKLTQCVTPDS